jgi:hypothetical protein
MRKLIGASFSIVYILADFFQGRISQLPWGLSRPQARGMSGEEGEAAGRPLQGEEASTTGASPVWGLSLSKLILILILIILIIYCHNRTVEQ